MRKKKIIITLLIIVLLLILIPLGAFGVFVTKNILIDGKEARIIYADEPMPDDIEAGTPIVLEIPNKSKDTIEELEKEKKQATTESLTAEIDSEYNVNEIGEEIYEMAGFKEKEEKEEKFLEVFKKYYGSAETEALFAEIRDETNKRNSFEEPYKFPETAKKLLTAVIDIIDTKNLTDEEREALVCIVQSMDLTTLDDKELVNHINNL